MKKTNILASAFVLSTAALLVSQPIYSQVLVKGVTANTKSEYFVTKIVSLRNRTADDVYKLIQNLKNRIDIDCDSSTNSIILMGDKRLVSEA